MTDLVIGSTGPSPHHQPSGGDVSGDSPEEDTILPSSGNEETVSTSAHPSSELDMLDDEGCCASSTTTTATNTTSSSSSRPPLSPDGSALGANDINNGAGSVSISTSAAAGTSSTPPNGLVGSTSASLTGDAGSSSGCLVTTSGDDSMASSVSTTSVSPAHEATLAAAGAISATGVADDSPHLEHSSPFTLPHHHYQLLQQQQQQPSQQQRPLVAAVRPRRLHMMAPRRSRHQQQQQQHQQSQQHYNNSMQSAVAQHQQQQMLGQVSPATCGQTDQVTMAHHLGIPTDPSGLMYYPHGQLEAMDYPPFIAAASPYAGCYCQAPPGHSHHQHYAAGVNNLSQMYMAQPQMMPVSMATQQQQSQHLRQHHNPCQSGETMSVNGPSHLASHQSGQLDGDSSAQPSPPQLCNVSASIETSSIDPDSLSHQAEESAMTSANSQQQSNSSDDPHVVQVHVNPGVLFNVRTGEEMHHIMGPMTVPMVSQNGQQHPIALQVPPGHVVQQVIDEHGALRHVFISLQQLQPMFNPAGLVDGSGVDTNGPYAMMNGAGPGNAAPASSGGSRTNTPPSPPPPNMAPPPTMPTGGPYHHPALAFHQHPYVAAVIAAQAAAAAAAAGHYSAMSPPVGPLGPTGPPPQVAVMAPSIRGAPNGPSNSIPGSYLSRTRYARSNQQAQSVNSSNLLPTSQQEQHQQQMTAPQSSQSVGPDEDSSGDDRSAAKQGSTGNYHGATYRNSHYNHISATTRNNGASVIVTNGCGQTADGTVNGSTVASEVTSNGQHHQMEGVSSNGLPPVSQRRSNGSGNGGGTAGSSRKWRKQLEQQSGSSARRGSNSSLGSTNSNKASLSSITSSLDQVEGSGGAAPTVLQSSVDQQADSSGSVMSKPVEPTVEDSRASSSASSSAGSAMTRKVGATSGDQERTEPTNSSKSTGIPLSEPENPERARQIAALEAALSRLSPPQILNVTSTSLTVEMAPLPVEGVLSALGLGAAAAASIRQHLLYDVSLSVPLRANQLENIYTGPAAEVNVVDLRPATNYSIEVSAVYNGQLVLAPTPTVTTMVRGRPAQIVTFITQSAAPDKPEPIRLARNGAKSTSLQLRWLAPASDNGSPLLEFLLEWKLGQVDQSSLPTAFSELLRCHADVRSHRVQNLHPSTLYVFRLAAINSIGQSPFSEEVSYRTSGAAPSPPESPQLFTPGVSSLTLGWRQPDVGTSPSSCQLEYILQMDDLISGHGFLPVYKGPELFYTVPNLRRNSDYSFHLAVSNDDGQSKWSEPVVFKTLPDVPRPPVRLVVRNATSKGQSGSPYALKLQWEPPRDDGGAHIEAYEAQAIAEATDSTPVETSPVQLPGSQLDCVIDGLQPGRLYRCRVRCRTSGGNSEWCEPVAATTMATHPGPCSSPPVLSGRAKPTSLAIKWSPPPSDGGSQVMGYEVRQATLPPSPSTPPAASDWISVYEGADVNVVVHNLLPGRTYVFQARAINKVGAGPWVPSTVELSAHALSTAPACPDAPAPPIVSCPTPHTASIHWSEPTCNGSPIVEYRLEMLASSSTLVGLPATSCFSLVFHGPQRNFDAKSLQPATAYSFRVQAVNVVGASAYSPVVTCQTPPAPPSQPIIVLGQALTPHSVKLGWTVPSCNGSQITSYAITLTPGDQLLSVLPPAPPSPTGSTAPGLVETSQPVVQRVEHIIENLTPDTAYRLRVQAVNALGAGTHSTQLKVATPPLPPQPPELELAEASHNSLRLRWAPSSGPSSASASKDGDVIEYTLFVDKPSAPNRLQQIYTGTALSFRATRLQEKTTYHFAIQARSQAGGLGVQSMPKAFTTTPAPPSIPNGLTVAMSTEQTEIVASWKPVSYQNCPVEYVLQLATSSAPSTPFSNIYQGPDTSFSLANHISPASAYSLRIAAAGSHHVELASELVQQIGAFSSAVTFRTHSALNPVTGAVQLAVEPQAVAPSSGLTANATKRQQQGKGSKNGGSASNNTAGNLSTSIVQPGSTSASSDTSTGPLSKLFNFVTFRWLWRRPKPATTPSSSMDEPRVTDPSDTRLAVLLVFGFAVLAIVLSAIAHRFLTGSGPDVLMPPPPSTLSAAATPPPPPMPPGSR